MNPLTTLFLADDRNGDRLAAACARASRAARRLALRSAHAVEPADVLVGVTGRRLPQVPRWWRALEAGRTLERRTAVIVAVKHSEEPSGCTTC
jgi:hypothetical protein